MGDALGYETIVIGGGPAGLLSAGFRAQRGERVCLLERQPLPARKLGITGRGRCNVTHAGPMSEFPAAIPAGADFLRTAFATFTNEDIRSLLRSQGVETIEERGARIYPASGRARDVVDALVGWALNAGVEIRKEHRAIRVEKTPNAFAIGVETPTGSVRFESRQLIIATGGMGYPSTGSSGDGYELAASLGHTIVEPYAAVVGLRTRPSWRSAVGLELRNAQASIVRTGESEPLDSHMGEVLVSRGGFEGSAIYRISRTATAAMQRGEKRELLLDLKPALSHGKLLARCQRERESRPHERLGSAMRALLPAAMVDSFLAHIALSPQLTWARLSESQFEAIVLSLKGLRFAIEGPMGWERTIVTGGGVSTEEVNPETMESRLVPGLFFCGELLDVDGKTGGYNLQIAYSTAALAGGFRRN